MKRKSLEGTVCPIGRSLDIIGDWWTLLILRDAFAGKSRFGEFQKSLGVAKNILTVRLRKLVESGILETVPASDGSAYQDYRLTAKGRGLFPVLVALGEWGSEHLFKTGEACSILVERGTDRPVGKLELHAADGRLLTSDDVELRPGRAA